MGVSLTVLASGSRGNSALVCSSRTRVLVDAGISCRETFKRLKAVGEDPHQLSAIVITHEHSDHVAGLGGAGAEAEHSHFYDWARRIMPGRAPSAMLLVNFLHVAKLGDF